MESICGVSVTFQGLTFAEDGNYTEITDDSAGDYDACSLYMTFPNVTIPSADIDTAEVVWFDGEECIVGPFGDGCNVDGDTSRQFTYDGSVWFGWGKTMFVDWAQLFFRRHTTTLQMSYRVIFSMNYNLTAWKYFDGTLNCQYVSDLSTCEATSTYTEESSKTNTDTTIHLMEFDTGWINITDCSESTTTSAITSPASVVTTATYTVETFTDLDACGGTTFPGEPVFADTAVDNFSTDCPTADYPLCPFCGGKLRYPVWSWANFYVLDAPSGTQQASISFTFCP